MNLSRQGFLIAAAAGAMALTGCGGKKAKAAKPPRLGSTETGIASWYGHPYHGRRAANGEIYDMEKLTAAHRTLPFETWVRVRNLSNDRTIDVRIQDRGPFVGGRIIDLSKAAAREIEMLGPGVTKVRLTIISAPPRRDLERQTESFSVQVGAFRDRERAEALSAVMQSQYGYSTIVSRSGDGIVYRVLVGKEEDEANASSLAEKIRATGTAAFVVRLDTPEQR